MLPKKKVRLGSPSSGPYHAVIGTRAPLIRFLENNAMLEDGICDFRNLLMLLIETIDEYNRMLGEDVVGPSATERFVMRVYHDRYILYDVREWEPVLNSYLRELYRETAVRIMANLHIPLQTHRMAFCELLDYDIAVTLYPNHGILG